MEILKVSTQSKPRLVAGAIAGIVRTGDTIEILAVGAGAVNQTMKSVAIARGYVAPNGIEIICIPAFSETEIAGELKTSMKFIIEKR